MFKPKEYEGSSEYGTFGTHYDWPTGGNTPTGTYDGLTSFVGQRMPVNYTNKPNKTGGFSEGKDWLQYTQLVHNKVGDHAKVFRVSWDRAYEGRFRVNPNSFPPPDYTEGELYEMLDELRDKGAEAWNAMRPAQPDFSLALSLYELREIPRMYQQILRTFKRRSQKEAKRRGKSKLSRTAEWYLAIQFGWLPLIRDIRNFSNTFRQKEKILRQLIRDEGRPIKRRRKISSPPVAKSTKSWTFKKPYNSHCRPTLVLQCYKTGRWSGTTRTSETEYETWCFGQFRYLLPKGPRTSEWYDKLYRRIFGFRITPSLVYNAIPWTWLGDYFTDLGEFVNAVSDGVEDQLIADHAYVMRTIKNTYKVEAKQATYSSKSGAFARPKATMIVTRKVKMRVTASPFGFGLKEENLTSKQVSILGALGLSRLP